MSNINHIKASVCHIKRRFVTNKKIQNDNRIQLNPQLVVTFRTTVQSFCICH